MMGVSAIRIKSTDILHSLKGQPNLISQCLLVGCIYLQLLFILQIKTTEMVHLLNVDILP